MSNKNNLAYILLILTTIFWSGNFIVGKAASIYEIPPFSLNFYRWFFAGLILMPFTIKEILDKRKYILDNIGFFIIWDDDRNGNSDIYGQRIDLNGNIIGDADGIAIAVADNDQTEPTISYNQSLNEVMVCWEDYRSGTYYDIFCNTIDGESLEV